MGRCRPPVDQALPVAGLAVTELRCLSCEEAEIISDRAMRASTATGSVPRRCSVMHTRSAAWTLRSSTTGPAPLTGKTWGQLRDLTADLPAGQNPGQEEHDAG